MWFLFLKKISISSALTHIDHSESLLTQLWSLHEARLNRCLALRRFEERFKELQCQFSQLYQELQQLPDLHTSLHLIECYRTDNQNSKNQNNREEIDQTLIQVDDLSQRAQVRISIKVMLVGRSLSSGISRR